MLSTEELCARGRDASTAGRHALAVSLLGRAVDRAADDRQRAMALQSLAHATAERGAAEDGIAAFPAPIAKGRHHCISHPASRAGPTRFTWDPMRKRLRPPCSARRAGPRR